MLLLAIYLIGFAAMFVWQWTRRGGKFGAAFAVGLIWPILTPITLIKYLGNLAGYNL